MVLLINLERIISSNKYTAYAKYKSFKIENADLNYKLIVSDYEGTGIYINFKNKKKQ